MKFYIDGAYGTYNSTCFLDISISTYCLCYCYCSASDLNVASDSQALLLWIIVQRLLGLRYTCLYVYICIH